ncbi:MAG: hypothetical protein IKC46_05080 [Lachnospiraceae bacterium]|nr:hypothetical protein [Lachnospiraceae bacterium]
MSNELFPRTTVAGISLPRMLIGTNWMAGWSHRTPSADLMIQERHAETDSVCRMLEVFVNNGIDAIMGLFNQTPVIHRAILETEQKLGKKITMIDTPIINVDDNAAARKEAEAMIKRSKELGSTFCLIHHSSAEQLVNKNKQQIQRLDDYTQMIRDNGLIPGLSAHMPELIVYSDLNNYDVETYIQLYNCMGFLMQVEVETVNQIIRNAKKPVMTIKPMAAGRVTPFVGLNFNWATLRDCDMVTVGCFNEREALEDIEISRAALEMRAARIGKRTSPNQNQDAFGK